MRELRRRGKVQGDPIPRLKDGHLKLGEEENVAAKKKPSDELWARAKKLCRLNARQVAMAKKLGMNPKTLPSLIPSKSQQWKQPVGGFIETLYAKRFDRMPEPARQEATGQPSRRRARAVESSGSRPMSELHFALADRDDPTPSVPPRQESDDARWVAQDVVCHLINVAEDLEKDLANDRVTPEMMASIAKDLRRVANEIESDAHVSEMPYTDLTDLDDRDDEIPF